MGYICGRMGKIYTSIIKFEDELEWNTEQKKLLTDIKRVYGCALTFGKYVVDKLVRYKRLLDPNFTGEVQKHLYANELAFQEKVEENSKKLLSNDIEWKMPDESLFKDQPCDSWKKGYDILYVYVTGYKLLKKLYDISEGEQKEAVNEIINTTMASYYMAGRMTNKLNEYNEQLKDTDFNDNFYKIHKYDMAKSIVEYEQYIKDLVHGK